MTSNQVNTRQQQILDRIALDGEVKLGQLKETFEDTEMTLFEGMPK
jgi:DeoR family fructose operon transcriptional repressor